MTDGNMAEAIEDGDLTLFYRSDDFESGDVLLYTDQYNQKHLARVLALPGQTVDLNDQTALTVDGQITEEAPDSLDVRDIGTVSYPIVLDENEYFLLNDVLDDTDDSRKVGPVSLNQIQGKVIALFRRRNI